jgi:hypothetical protein
MADENQPVEIYFVQYKRAFSSPCPICALHPYPDNLVSIFCHAKYQNTFAVCKYVFPFATAFQRKPQNLDGILNAVDSLLDDQRWERLGARDTFRESSFDV